MASPTIPSTPLLLTAEQRQALQDFSALLAQRTAKPLRIIVTDADGESGELSGVETNELVAALDTALKAFPPEQPIEIIGTEAELTTTRAARMLGVSRQYLVRLLDRGAIPFHMVGSHRRILVGDLVAYRRRRRAGIEELARLSEDLGIYG